MGVEEDKPVVFPSRGAEAGPRFPPRTQTRLGRALIRARHTPAEGKSHRCPVQQPLPEAADSILPLPQTDAVTAFRRADLAAQGTLAAAEQTDTSHALAQEDEAVACGGS